MHLHLSIWFSSTLQLEIKARRRRLNILLKERSKIKKIFKNNTYYWKSFRDSLKYYCEYPAEVEYLHTKSLL